MGMSELIYFSANSHYYHFALVFGNNIIGPVPVMVLSRNRVDAKEQNKMCLVISFEFNLVEPGPFKPIQESWPLFKRCTCIQTI